VQKWLIRAVFQNRTINLQKSLKESGKIEDGRPETEVGRPGWKLDEIKRSLVNSHWSSVIDYLKTLRLELGT